MCGSVSQNVSTDSIIEAGTKQELPLLCGCWWPSAFRKHEIL